MYRCPDCSRTFATRRMAEDHHHAVHHTHYHDEDSPTFTMPTFDLTSPSTDFGGGGNSTDSGFDFGGGGGFSGGGSSGDF